MCCGYCWCGVLAPGNQSPMLSTHLVLESSEISSVHSTPYSCQHFVKCCICDCQTIFYDDVLKWKHFLRYWLFVRGIHRLSLNSPRKGQWHRALMFSLICAWINGWVNNRESDAPRFALKKVFRKCCEEHPAGKNKQLLHSRYSILDKQNTYMITTCRIFLSEIQKKNVLIKCDTFVRLSTFYTCMSMSMDRIA